MKCGLLGRKLGHSYSPQIHSLLADYTYDLFEKEPEELEGFLHSEAFTGINVTVPYKQAVIPYLDELTPLAEKLGAVNTIVLKNGKLIGHNTDYFGFRYMLSQLSVDLRDKKALVLGSGGASKTVCAVLQDLGCQAVIISRAGEGMHTPKGLEGKKYATWDLDVEKATIRDVMKADGGNFDLVQLIPSTVTDEVSALQSGSVDAIWIFYGWAGVACQVAGLDTDYFEFADIDPAFDYYTPVIIGNDAWLAEHPETAKAFVAALSKGYTDAVNNPKEAADILMNAAPELKANSQLVYASQQYLAKEYIADAARWGEFDGSRWAAFFNWLNKNDLLAEKIDPNHGFTNSFLPQ